MPFNVKGSSMLTEFALVLVAAMWMVAMAAGNGATEPVSQSLVLLQRGNTAERREAVGVLARLGDQRAVEPLAAALKNDADIFVRQGAEQALWQIWHRSGDDAVDALLQEGMEAMQRGAYQTAVDLFTRVIQVAPDFAEGYNKRATTYYLMQRYEESIADCERTIALNPHHFGALSGAGLCHLSQRNLAQALEFFERAVVVNPNMPQIQQYIEDIRRFLRDQSF
jgi:tetratricopeptide (TPR) repeat protein